MSLFIFLIWISYTNSFELIRQRYSTANRLREKIFIYSSDLLFIPSIFASLWFFLIRQLFLFHEIIRYIIIIITEQFHSYFQLYYRNFHSMIFCGQITEIGIICRVCCLRTDDPSALRSFEEEMAREPSSVMPHAFETHGRCSTVTSAHRRCARDS